MLALSLYDIKLSWPGPMPVWKQPQLLAWWALHAAASHVLLSEAFCKNGYSLQQDLPTSRRKTLGYVKSSS